jgi:RNA polymerase sigma-70 factor (ECF subfamily)
MIPDEAEPPDSELLAAAASGSESAFSALFHRYHGRIHAFAYRIVLDQQAAEDIAQDTFIRAAKALQAVREGQAFAAWVYRIASNLSKDHLRSQSSHRRKLTEAAAQVECQSPCGSADSERAAAALKAMEALPLKQRQAIALVWFDGCNHAEAAARLGCAESTVSWRLALAKRTLRKRISP